MKNRLKNKMKNKNVLKATQIVNIVTNPRRQKKRHGLSQGNDTLIRNIHHFNTPIFQPIPTQPQPVGTRPDIENTVATLQRSVKQLQSLAFPETKSILQTSSPLKMEKSAFRADPEGPKRLISDHFKKLGDEERKK